MFAFIFFWAYIAFCQYMLIWYGNIPEETVWFLPRQERRAGAVERACCSFGHFVLPFAGLMSRCAKRHPASLAFWAVWILGVHWLDTYWLVMPSLHPGELRLPPDRSPRCRGLGGILVGAGWRRGCATLAGAGARSRGWPTR